MNISNFKIALRQLGAFCLVGIAVVFAQSAEPVASVYSLKGVVEFRRSAPEAWEPLEKGSQLYDGYEVRTDKGARLGVKFVTGKLLRLRENSYMRMSAPSESEPGGKVGLVSGVMHLFSRNKADSPRVDTRDVSAAIRGSEVVVKVLASTTEVTVLEGAVTLANSSGSLSLAKGELGTAAAERAPQRVLLAKPEESVQWALYYPAVLSLADFDYVFVGQRPKLVTSWGLIKSGQVGEVTSLLTGTDPFERLAQALAYHVQGKPQLAIRALDGLTQVEARIIRASSALSGGSIEEARGELAGLEQHPLGAALLAIISVVQNDLSEAFKYASAATSGAQPALAGLLARSFVHQARFEYAEAEMWALKVLEREPENRYAQARLAEFSLGRGDVSGALGLVSGIKSHQAVGAYELAVKGFAQLTSAKVGAAKQTFTEAIAADSEQGLPHLGLGLALIREGDLQAGRLEIEKAIHLEPARAMYRSYLGKTFFEAELEDQADNEFERAIDLDPQDPTPYLYRAFNSLSQNRLVAALEDIERSIERNNNRAVYRAQNLLDEDSSTRSTSLAEVYQQLGFSRIAQLEAMHSINKDYTNFGAHRLLSQSYEGDFYADTQFTESTIADILAPLSLNVFQGLSGYSSEASLNEYTALFDRDQQRTGINLGWASAEDQVNGSIFQTGRLGQVGYYGGYRTLYARGRKANNNYTRLNRIDLAGQYQPNHENRVLTTFAVTRDDDQYAQYGDDIEDVEVSLASHHTLGKGFEGITRFEYFRRRRDAFDRDSSRVLQEGMIIDSIFTPFDYNVVTANETTDDNYDNYNVDLQLIRDYGRFSWILGTDLNFADLEASEKTFVSSNPSQVFEGISARVDSASNVSTFSHNTYLYTTYEASDWVTINTGLAFGEIELPAYAEIAPYIDGRRTESLWAPKLGLTFTPLDELTVRSAYFRSLGRSNLSSQARIEPSLVGSFSQRFRDLPGSETENFGLGFDYKIPAKHYFGAEYIYRDIKRDLPFVNTNVAYNFDDLVEDINFSSQLEPDNANEHVVRAYSYHVLGEKSSLTLDYGFWDLSQANLDTSNVLHRAALALNYFSSDRWFGFIEPTWRQQELINRLGFKDGSEAFTVLDVGAGYRLPNRHGALRLVLRNVTDETFQYEDRGREAPVYSGFNAALEATFNF